MGNRLYSEHDTEATELTYDQLIERLKFISKDNGDCKVSININSKLCPRKLLKGNICKFNINGNKIKAFTEPRPNQVGKKYTIGDALVDLIGLKKKYKNDIALIMSAKSGTFSICGVYFMEKENTVVLMNGYYKGKVIDWKVQGITMY